MALSAAAAPAKLPQLAYPFANQGEYWINSEPIGQQQLRGKPVLVFFWTLGCYNCKNSIAWINSVQQRYASQGLQLIGIHTPEFDYEKNRPKVVAATSDFAIEFPVMLDNDHIFWKDMRNLYWPAFYLADANLEIRAEAFGEIHPNTERARALEALIEKLIGS